MARKNNKERSDAVTWKGEHIFYINGTGHEDDTLRVRANRAETKKPLSLILPTLCITYADMKFANKIGGIQKAYPESIPYGEKYFKPSVTLSGEKEIERFTWIRGAESVTIGTKRTIISWPSWKTLVIPKLRIRAGEKAEARVNVPEIHLTVDQPFEAKTMQFADGRHIGGVQLVKRHPDWKPVPVDEKYDLWVRIIDGKSRRAIQKAHVTVWDWKTEDDGTHGAFTPAVNLYTDEMGIAQAEGLDCSDKQLLTVEAKQWKNQAHRFRPFPGQKIKRTFKMQPLKHRTTLYQWDRKDTLKTLAHLSSTAKPALLRMNRFKTAREIPIGQQINLPCFQAAYTIEPRDTLERIAEYFCYHSTHELAAANNITSPPRIFTDQELILPGWRFFIAPAAELFEEFDDRFGIPRGWTRPAMRTLHDIPSQAYEREMIAVPESDFVSTHKLRRLY